MYVVESSAETTRPQAQVAVVSPQQLYLDALQRLLRSPAYTIVGAGRTLEEALEGRSLDLPLSMVVYNLDADEEIEQEIDNIIAVQEQFPFTRLVILADCRLAATKLKVMQAGIEAILSRDISIDVLRSSLELVLLGKCIVPAELARPLLKQHRDAVEVVMLPSPCPAAALPRPTVRDNALLSGREQQILQCLINGLTNKAIARDLDISEATVKVHIKALLRKTRLANRTQAAIWALNNAPDGGPLPEAGAETLNGGSGPGQQNGSIQVPELAMPLGTDAARIAPVGRATVSTAADTGPLNPARAAMSFRSESMDA